MTVMQCYGFVFSGRRFTYQDSLPKLRDLDPSLGWMMFCVTWPLVQLAFDTVLFQLIHKLLECAVCLLNRVAGVRFELGVPEGRREGDGRMF